MPPWGVAWVRCSTFPALSTASGSSCRSGPGPRGLVWQPGRAVASTQALTGPCFPQRILLACDKRRDMTVEEAKVAFLKWICRWPTFGSAFFEVKVGRAPSPAILATQAPPGSGPSSLSFSPKHATGRASGQVWGSKCARVCVRASRGGAAWPPRLGCDHCDPPPSPANLGALLPGHHPHRHQPARGSAHPPQDQGSGRTPGTAPGSLDPCAAGAALLGSHTWPHGLWRTPGSSSDSGPLGRLGFDWLLPTAHCAPRTCSPPTPSPRLPAGAAAVLTSTWCWGAWAGAAACCVRPLW